MKNWIVEIMEYIFLCLEQDIFNPIILKLGKTPRGYGCAWSNCDACGAEKSEPCKRLWQCKSRDKLIDNAIEKSNADSGAKHQEQMKAWHLKQLKEVVAHWT